MDELEDLHMDQTYIFTTMKAEGEGWVCLFVLRFYGPVNPVGSCQARSVYLTTHLLGRLNPLSGLTSIVYILLPETYNCPS